MEERKMKSPSSPIACPDYEVESLFQWTLDDLIKGLRLHTPTSTPSLSAFISKSLTEIRRELTSTTASTKSTALLKLLYLHSLHSISASFATFHVIELSSSPASKPLAYLAASLLFDSTTDVLLLLTNQLRKDLNSTITREVSLALNALSVIANQDLARNLTGRSS